MEKEEEKREKRGRNLTVWQQYTRDFLTVPCPVYFRGKCCKITVNTAFSRDLQVRHGNGEKKKKKGDALYAAVLINFGSLGGC